MGEKKPGEFLDDGDYVFDEAEELLEKTLERSVPEGVTVDVELQGDPSDIAKEVFNGLTDKDLSEKEGPFSFTCSRREYSATRDGYDYHVVPDEEYGDLDFEGRVVSINSRLRHCHSFNVDDDGNIVIFVTSLSEAKS